MDKWFKDILPDKDPYHNRGRDQMRKKGGPEFECLNMISLHSYLVYTYEQQIFIDEIQVYSRRHIQLSPTRAYSGGQLNIDCFALLHIVSYLYVYISNTAAGPRNKS
jgi:hypothetical protein